MKRLIHGLLVAMLLIGNVAAKTYSNKTFLTPRSHLMNLAMEKTTWHKQTDIVPDKNFGGTIQVTGFYEESENKRSLGKYFGVSNYLTGDCSEDFIAVVPDFDTDDHPKHIGAGHIIHNAQHSTDAAYTTLADKITWRPDRESYGIRIDYHQKLDKILKGLFFKISIPIVHVQTSMGFSSTCCQSSCGTTCTPAAYCVRQPLPDTNGDLTVSTTKSLADYLTGNVVNTAVKNKQAALCKAKIHNGNSETGIADIDLIIGYNFLYEPTKHFNASFGITFPTGNTPDGEYLFPAIVGNCNHWAIGCGLDAKFQIWKRKKMTLDVLTACNYRYLFSSTEKRTPGLIWPAGTYANKRVFYGQWWLGAKKGDTTLTPMANLITRDMTVYPGSHFDSVVQFAFNWSGFTFDLGYNLFAKEAEKVRLKGEECCNPCATSCTPADCGGWRDNTYAISDLDWQTDSAFAAGDTYYSSSDWINREHLCLDACTQPSVVTHKIYGGAGYAFNDWDYPLMLGLGGSYEFETDNDSLDGWSVWAKIGVTF
jgi:hypothetical protein